ncbi:hypothetical protein [Lewinella sp. IMCC34183]|uniref:hypothetical protein n=1 Tax=Lewinella sp. IMCC34183 TaxID=2248762 RepID=UPI000E25151E|nr:hypothetical protein [Lewinella sp. IMCC34183]
MTLYTKIKWVLGFALVFLLVLTTNLVDRQNFRVMKDSMEAIYADRLVAQDILLTLSRQVWETESRYRAGGPVVAGARLEHPEIDRAIQRFAATTLTREEETVFSRLQARLRELSAREAALQAGDGSRDGVLEALGKVKQELVDLSAIQMVEGRRQLFAGKKAVSSAELFTQLEIGALIVLALCVQVVILYAPATPERA